MSSYSTFTVSKLLNFFKIDKAPLNVIDWYNFSVIILPTCYKERHVDNDDLALLFKVYCAIFPDKNILIKQLSRTIQKYSTIEIFNKQFGSKSAYRSKRSAGIIAAWPKQDGEIDLKHNIMSFGMVDFYFSHSLNVGGDFVRFYFACVTWHQTVNDTNFNFNPLIVASKVDKLPIGTSRFLPVQHISTKCAIAIEEIQDTHERYIISPLPRHFAS